MSNECNDAFFQHDGGECICTMCGARAPSATQLKHRPECIAGRLTARHMDATMEDRVSTLEHSVAELEESIDNINRFVKNLGTELGRAWLDWTRKVE